MPENIFDIKDKEIIISLTLVVGFDFFAALLTINDPVAIIEKN